MHNFEPTKANKEILKSSVALGLPSIKLNDYFRNDAKKSRKWRQKNIWFILRQRCKCCINYEYSLIEPKTKMHMGLEYDSCSIFHLLEDFENE